MYMIGTQTVPGDLWPMNHDSESRATMDRLHELESRATMDRLHDSESRATMSESVIFFLQCHVPCQCGSR